MRQCVEICVVSCCYSCSLYQRSGSGDDKDGRPWWAGTQRMAVNPVSPPKTCCRRRSHRAARRDDTVKHRHCSHARCSAPSSIILSTRRNASCVLRTPAECKGAVKSMRKNNVIGRGVRSQSACRNEPSEAGSAVFGETVFAGGQSRVRSRSVNQSILIQFYFPGRRGFGHGVMRYIHLWIRRHAAGTRKRPPDCACSPSSNRPFHI